MTLQAQFGVWVHPRLSPPCFESGAWVEVWAALTSTLVQPHGSRLNLNRPRRRLQVMRVDEATDRVGAAAAWYYHAPGSGVWLHLGRTRCGQTPAKELLGVSKKYALPLTAGSPLPARDFALVTQARRARLDTVQRREPDNTWSHLEIIDVRHAVRGGGICAGAAAGVLRGGWNGSRECRCDPAGPVVTCSSGGEG